MIEVKNSGAPSYLTYAGKPAQPAARAAKPADKQAAKKQPSPIQEPGLATVPADYRDPLPFAFKKGDVVAILGNGLPDRMQHDGWLEAL